MQPALRQSATLSATLAEVCATRDLAAETNGERLRMSVLGGCGQERPRATEGKGAIAMEVVWVAAGFRRAASHSFQAKGC